MSPFRSERYRELLSRLSSFADWLPRGTELPERSWRSRHRLLTALVWLQLPILFIIALQAGETVSHAIGHLMVIALAVSGAGLVRGRGGKAIMVSLALITTSGILVHLTHGLIESHFHFFVMIPLISLYRDWRPMATGLAFVILHHSAFGVISPEAIYNHPAALANPVRWAFIHGGFILLMTAVILAYWRFNETLETELATEHDLRLAAEAERHRIEKERLANVVESKDRFIASVSHELRTPLSAVLGFAQLLSDTDDRFSDDERAELASTIAREAYDLSGIVEDLLVAARAEIDAVNVSAVPVDLAANVAQVVEILPADQAARVSIAPSCATRALADPVRVRQVIRNLVTNALRHGGEHVWIDLDADDAHVALVVGDDGPGIPVDQQDLVFLPYHTGHHVTTQPSSVGLGLSVSRQLAELMGGSLDYRLADGRSSFVLRLPVAVAARPLDHAATHVSR